MFALPRELTLPFNKNLVPLLHERSHFCLLYTKSGESYLTSSDEAKSFVENIKSTQKTSGERLYGNVAHPGKVEGIARIIFTTDDLPKMKQGDILIAPCTRPEYVTAMKKASAILTDEGGVTSHAAIVSRELGVPCIVGLRNATDLFHDGDLLLVNANHGIVSVVKKNTP